MMYKQSELKVKQAKNKNKQRIKLKRQESMQLPVITNTESNESRN